MSADKRLTELADAKRLLVLQADLHRNLIRLEGEALRERFAALTAVGRTLEASRPLLFAGVALAGVLALRRGGALLRWGPVVIAGYRWLGRLLKKRG